MRRARVKSIFWGILLIVTAACVVMSYMGFIDAGNPIKIGFTVIFAGIMITSLIDLNFFGFFFPAALICIMFDDLWGIEKLTPWPVLGIAILLTVGFSLIFKKKPRQHCPNDYSDNVVEEYADAGDSIVNCDAKFNGVNKYIHSKCLRKVNVKCVFGGVELYLDNATLAPEGATINLDVAFGGVDIFVPKGWKVVNNVSASFGAVDESGRTATMEGAPTLYINGKVAFGGADIKYV